jgi:hypothetical protein
MRILHLLAYFILDMNKPVQSEPTQDQHGHNSSRCDTFLGDLVNESITPLQIKAWALVVILYSTVILIVDVVELVLSFQLTHKVKWENLLGKKTLAVRVRFYRGAQFVTAVFTWLGASTVLFDYHMAHVFAIIIRCAIPLLMAWTSFFFLQSVPYFGEFVITVQRMLKSVLHFFVVFVIMMLPFVLAYALYVMNDVKGECVGGFASIDEAFYSLFRLMLNISMINSNQFGDPEIFWLLHVFFVFGVSIIMINLLIAVMSDNVAVTSKCMGALIKMQRLSMLLTLENRLGRPLKRYYDWIKSKHFVCQKGRIYLPAAVQDNKQYTVKQRTIIKN